MSKFNGQFAEPGSRFGVRAAKSRAATGLMSLGYVSPHGADIAVEKGREGGGRPKTHRTSKNARHDNATLNTLDSERTWKHSICAHARYR